MMRQVRNDLFDLAQRSSRAGPSINRGHSGNRMQEKSRVSGSSRCDVYCDFGVISSLLVLAPGADGLPEPVVCALELVALARCRCLTLAMCFFCLWLATCFFTRVATLHVSSFGTLAPGIEAVPGLPYCANAGEAMSTTVIAMAGTVNFM